jgi:hypothetical protein
MLGMNPEAGEPPAGIYRRHLESGVLGFQRCAGCGAAVFYPRVLCPLCGPMISPGRPAQAGGRALVQPPWHVRTASDRRGRAPAPRGMRRPPGAEPKHRPRSRKRGRPLGPGNSLTRLREHALVSISARSGFRLRLSAHQQVVSKRGQERTTRPPLVAVLHARPEKEKLKC